MIGIRWSPSATADLGRIVAYIEQDNPAAALRVAQAIHAAVTALSNFPQRGRTGKVSGTRELVLVPLPYIVVYEVAPEVVSVLRIRHGAQDWP